MDIFNSNNMTHKKSERFLTEVIIMELYETQNVLPILEREAGCVDPASIPSGRLLL
jgi:hypothetical protein